MKQKLLLLSVTILISASVFSQDSSDHSKPKPNWTDRISVGGNVGFSIGTTTYIEVAPQIGYSITPNWIAGLGGRYIYYKTLTYDYIGNVYKYQTSIYGGDVFTRYNIYKGIFADAEFEENNLDAYLPVFDSFGNLIGYNAQRTWVPSLLLGGGYSQSIGGKASFNLTILYDVIQNINSPYYQQPVIRGGVSFGL